MTWNHQCLSDVARLALVHSGWREDRKTPTRAYRIANEQVGLQFHSCAEQYLENIGGLSFKYMHFANAHELRTCVFNPTIACSSDMSQWLHDYQRFIGIPLSVVGEMDNGYFTLLMANNWYIYGGRDYDLILVGESPAKAINNLCAGVELSILEIPRSNHAHYHEETLTAESLQALLEAGWKDVSVLGIDLIEDFKLRYGGIILRARNVVGGTVYVRLFGSGHEASWCIPNAIHKKIGETVRPIGEYQGSNIYLIMAESGRVFSFMPELPDDAWELGRSCEVAINNIVSGSGGDRV